MAPTFSFGTQLWIKVKFSRICASLKAVLWWPISGDYKTEIYFTFPFSSYRRLKVWINKKKEAKWDANKNDEEENSRELSIIQNATAAICSQRK